MRKTLGVVAALGSAAVVLAACGSAPAPSPSTSSAPTSSSAAPTSSSAAPAAFKACMVSDAGGYDDKSFNETAYKGLEAAKNEFGVEILALESKSDADYEPNINNAIQQGCNMVITVGFLLGDATEKAAKANPDVEFAIVDYAYEAPSDNLKGLVFATEQPSYLAGYLAAATSKTGSIATYGGIPIPSVTAFMSGYYQGATKFNEDNGGNVKVLGWDPADVEKGTYAGGFDDQNKGKQIAKNFFQQGADIVFPVAGPVGLGSAAEAQAKAGERAVIWVDTDGCVSAAEFCDVFLTSVMKGLDVAVKDTIKQGVDGTFSNELYVGTLANGGVGLAPYGKGFNVPAEVTAKVDELKQQIIDGTILVNP